MANLPLVLVSFALLFSRASALAPNNAPRATKPAFNVQKVALNGAAAASIASALVVGPMADAAVSTIDAPSFGSSSLVAEKVTRQGLYREYDVDLGDQTFDDASSTFKSAKETKSKKGKYVAIIAILTVGAFIVPMLQYFWYVRDDSSFDKFFADKNAPPEPEPEPVKKGWFN